MSQEDSEKLYPDTGNVQDVQWLLMVLQTLDERDDQFLPRAIEPGGDDESFKLVYGEGLSE